MKRINREKVTLPTLSPWAPSNRNRYGPANGACDAMFVVANARQVKWITASDQKSDRVDAKKLAWLARADVRLLAPVEHRTAEQQSELSVIRARDAVARARTLLVNAARGIAKDFGQRLPATVTATFGKRAIATVPPMLQPALHWIDRADRRAWKTDSGLRGTHRAGRRHSSGSGEAD